MSAPDRSDAPGVFTTMTHSAPSATRDMRERWAKVLRAQSQLNRPTAAQLAARVMARQLPAAGPHRPPTDEERERLAALRGGLDVDRTPAGGLRLRARLPA